jgi:hypothetical protein
MDGLLTASAEVEADEREALRGVRGVLDLGGGGAMGVEGAGGRVAAPLPGRVALPAARAGVRLGHTIHSTLLYDNVSISI